MPRQPVDRLDQIVDQVNKWPGSNLRQISRATGIPLSTTARHVAELVDERRLRMEAGGGYTHFYPAGKGLHKRERVLLSALSKPRPRAILETILGDPGIQHKDLAAAVGIPAPTATYYLKQLVANDLVVARASGIERHYRIKNPDMLQKALERTARGYDAKVA